MEFVSKNAKKNIENHFDNEAKKAAKAGRYKDLSGERQSDAVEFVRGMVKEAAAKEKDGQSIRYCKPFVKGLLAKAQAEDIDLDDLDIADFLDVEICKFLSFVFLMFF